MKLVRCDAVEPQPWRNGGGLTRELLAWPSGESWSVRISVADIRSDGPFSAFAGVDRWFAVLEGAGVRLALPDGQRSVQAGDAPLHFSGEAAPRCELRDGPTRDLNLMLKRDAGRGALELARPGRPFGPPARLRALFAAEAAILQIDGGDMLPLPAYALAWSDDAHGSWRIVGDARPRAWWIHFEPA